MEPLAILSEITEDIQKLRQHRQQTWDAFLQIIYKYGIGIQPALRHLYQARPDAGELKQWLEANKTLTGNTYAETADVLTPDDIAFWHTNGYLVIKNAVSKNDCDQTINAIFTYLDKDFYNSSAWYKNHDAIEGLMVNFTQNEWLQKNRNNTLIKKAYEQLYGSARIHTTIDKVSINFPETEHYKFMGSGLHWDVSLQLPIPNKFQGLLYLTDVKAINGAFCCVPGFHHEIENWLGALPAGENPRVVALQTLKPIPVEANAGDFIVWHQALPHCASPNNSNTPRVVQYITYFPDDIAENDGGWI